MNLLSDYYHDYVMHRQVFMAFLLLLLYLITVACILEISLGSCWHKDECMGQRSTIHHNVQLFISLNNQYAVIWSPNGHYSMHQQVPVVFLIVLLVCLKYCLLRLCRKQYGLMLVQRYFKGRRSSINHKIKPFL